MANLEHLGTLWHPMLPMEECRSTKEERTCNDCGAVFVAYAYAGDAHCSACRANYSDYGRIGKHADRG